MTDGARRSGPLAFVLAGGGSLGAVEVGMLDALTDAGIRPDLVVGASVGAINGVYFAGDATRAGVERLRGVWNGVTRGDVFPWSMRGVLLGAVGQRRSLLESTHLRRLLEQQLPVRRLEETQIACYVTATDALDGSQVILSSGSAVEALLASAAIPVLFPPVEHEGRLLVDGGVASNTPIAAAVTLGARRIVVLPTGFSCAARQPPRGAIGMALHTFTLLVARQLVVDIERFATRADIVVVPPVCPLSISSYDFSHAAALMNRARSGTSDWLAEGGLARIGDVPPTLSAHRHAPLHHHRTPLDRRVSTGVKIAASSAR